MFSTLFSFLPSQSFLSSIISWLFSGDGKCVICDSYVRPCTLVRICDECNYGSYQGRCVICGGPGVSDAYYCKECTIQEKDVSTIRHCRIYTGYIYGFFVIWDYSLSSIQNYKTCVQLLLRWMCFKQSCYSFLLSLQRDGCPKIVNLGSSKTDLFYERKKYGFKKRWRCYIPVPVLLFQLFWIFFKTPRNIFLTFQ